MRVKKFNELFDSEDIKSHHEIDYLSGKVDKILKNISYPINFKNDSISYLISKISRYNFPFFDVFFSHPDGYNFKDFSSRISYLEEDDTWFFVTEKEDGVIISLGIKINKTNNYEAIIYAEGTDEDPIGYEYTGLSYNGLMEVIKEMYIPILIDNEMSEILDYNSQEIDINN